MVCSYPLLLDVRQLKPASRNPTDRYEQSLIKSASPSTYYYYEELKLGSEAAKRVADKIGKAQHRAEKERMIKNLQSRVKEWKLPRIADFGELLLNDIILTTKSDIVRHWNLHVFLFEKIIVCFKEIVPNVPNGDSKKHGKNNSLLKKQVISAPQNASRTTTRLVLKGRIYLKHVTRVMSMSLPAKTIGGRYRRVMGLPIFSLITNLQAIILCEFGGMATMVSSSSHCIVVKKNKHTSGKHKSIG